MAARQKNSVVQRDNPTKEIGRKGRDAENAQVRQEQKKHGSALFPFNIYPCTIPKDFPSVPLHWQSSMELIYIKKGQGICQVATETDKACAGDIFLLPPGRVHGLRGAAGQSMEYENIIFDTAFLGTGGADICAQRYLVPLAAGQLALPARLSPGSAGYDGAAAALARAERLCAQRKPGYELGVKGAMLELLGGLFAACNLLAAPADAPGTERLKQVLQRVEEGYALPMTVASAAKAVGCSQSHFMRWFRQMTGQSFVAYLNERRLAAAAEELRQTDETVLAVAEACGFENLSNFNRQFKARYGITPSHYRRGA